jgi:hypothetical protein
VSEWVNEWVNHKNKTQPSNIISRKHYKQPLTPHIHTLPSSSSSSYSHLVTLMSFKTLLFLRMDNSLFLHRGVRNFIPSTALLCFLRLSPHIENCLFES